MVPVPRRIRDFSTNATSVVDTDPTGSKFLVFANSHFKMGHFVVNYVGTHFRVESFDAEYCT
jgi:hypothetical protein